MNSFVSQLLTTINDVLVILSNLIRTKKNIESNALGDHFLSVILQVDEECAAFASLRNQSELIVEKNCARLQVPTFSSSPLAFNKQIVAITRPTIIIDILTADISVGEGSRKKTGCI